MTTERRPSPGSVVIAYKVVRKDDTGAMWSPWCPTSAVVRYEIGRSSTPKPNRGPLAAFVSKEAAAQWVRVAFGDRELTILECRVKVSPHTRMWCFVDGVRVVRSCPSRDAIYCDEIIPLLDVWRY